MWCFVSDARNALFLLNKHRTINAPGANTSWLFLSYVVNYNIWQIEPCYCWHCPSVRLSVPLLRVCCCGPGGQKISIDCCTAGVRRANAGSGTLVVVSKIANSSTLDDNVVSVRSSWTHMLQVGSFCHSVLNCSTTKGATLLFCSLCSNS